MAIVDRYKNKRKQEGSEQVLDMKKSKQKVGRIEVVKIRAEAAKEYNISC
jgi:hypothetical protein